MKRTTVSRNTSRSSSIQGMTYGFMGSERNAAGVSVHVRQGHEHCNQERPALHSPVAGLVLARDEMRLAAAYLDDRLALLAQRRAHGELGIVPRRELEIAGTAGIPLDVDGHVAARTNSLHAAPRPLFRH